eukprot:CAMPEP_0177583080 /NCGR_PEP_ID=MMETSP0419_2-20121207/3118_1 /TAXON_ID=582737 /ORGANISM="Tetraselmis sp., Strain GSL018" /LENGTH=318 /DNA_ID=CAMNT_0019072421 /DNA_START=140 /DNA_END=1093 /DNA_ORIENTATION=+
MFERQVAYYLNKYLGRYVYNVDASALQISIFKGNVQLSNLQLKPEALNSLNLPVTVKAGLLGSLKLKVPWSNLGGSPVICEMDGIYVLAVPNTGAQRDEKDFAAAEQKAKQQKIDQAEEEFIQLWKESMESGDVKAPAGTDQKSAGRLQSLMETILGNLQLSITNVHIRYEDPDSVPGQLFACGLTLQEVSANTVDSKGEKAFVVKNALEHLRKSARLLRFAVYFDAQAEAYRPQTGRWESMARVHWNELFLPGIESDLPAEEREYVLTPINGAMTFERLDGKQRRLKPDEEPTHKAVASLTSLSLHLSEGQYTCAQA